MANKKLPDPSVPLYVIERRHPDGALDLKGKQPESVFGKAAITGISDWEMAQIIFRTLPNLSNAELTGDTIPAWPAHIDSRWSARRKTW